MLRLLKLTTFVTILAAQSCFIEECLGCEMDLTRSQATTLDVGAVTTVEADCNTCKHASITAKWTNPLKNFGDVVLTVQGRCGSTKSQPQNRTVQVKNGTVTIADLGIKNLCGEDAAIKWQAWVTNESQDPITDVVIEFECPGSPATTNLAPSRVRSAPGP